MQAEEIRLGALGIKGNGHMMMAERNNREVLQPLMDWMNKNVTGSNNQAPAPRRQTGDSLALKFADFSSFWVGTERKTMPYGTIHVGPMFVQKIEPAQPRYPLPVLLVHGGGGQMVHYMGLGGMSGWAHHFVQAGYTVYLVDRPGHGRSVYHPDALGEIGPLVTYDLLTRDTVTSAKAPNKQWPAPPATPATRSVDQRSWRPPTRRRATEANSRRTCGGASQRSSIASGRASSSRIPPAARSDGSSPTSVRTS